ncbi:DNA-directed RNA polymerase specialized sigma24 family protein [Planomicrobium stackebrandtii]|uniref:DNA-directed RNA polymerase specialized sigma24 family protein n=1 Tax=Planomicrobium stackebrandtii TaxID=253160 RepID=A0ABU0H0P8_9BACL|nr:hypothetical protein [Planomicrobium stackebrandtii]MDQ0430375.1 DNA-directed RNA polymerase specialized sigma24 family protein [Planomicrobium stackebrandtii]
MTSLTDLYKQAQKGDSSAFYTWAESIQPEMGRFAYQLGVSYEDLPAFQQLGFQQLHKQLEQVTAEQAKRQLFKWMVQHATTLSIPQEGKAYRRILGFQEDQELHEELQKLELDQRISLILFYFHEVSLSDIMTITEESEQQLLELKKQGVQELQTRLHLQESQVVQRLGMLQKSYQRLMLPSSLGQNVQKAENRLLAAELIPLTAAPPRVQKKKAVVLGAAGLFLAAVIGISFSVNDQQARNSGTTEFQQADTVTDEMVADWRSQYDMIKKTSPQRLGMTEQQYNALDYVKLADGEMEKVFGEAALESLKEDPVRMQEEVDRLFRMAETPRGMAQSLSGPNPMRSSEVEAFLQDYAAKTDELRIFADSILLEYRQELESTIVMDQLSPEKLLAQTESFPDKLRLVVEALPEYNLFAVVHPNGNRFRTVRDVNVLNQQQPIANDPYAWQYLNLLSAEPYFDSSGFLVPLNTIPQHLITMEQALLEEGGPASLFDKVEVAYLQTFWQLIKGSGNSPVFNEEGKVQLEYRTAWSGVSLSNPMAYLMLPILEEMEASGWTTSKQYDELEFDDLSDALEMEKSGELADKLPNGNLVIEDEFVDLQDFDYSRVEPLYESFKASYDLQVLAGVPPLDVLFLYHYANKLDDRETLWHLFADSPIKPALQVFQEEWQPIPELTENANWIELSVDFYRQRVKDKVYIYPQVGSDEFLERLDVLLVTEKDRIWQIDYQRYNSYNLPGEDQQFRQRINSLYASVSGGSQSQLPVETPAGEVAGVFFKAADNKDIGTMKKLMAETGWTDDELSSFLELHNFQPFSEIEQIIFRTHFNPDMAAGLRGAAEIKYAAGSSGSLIQDMFFMEETADGWRMTGLNNY